MIKSASKMAAYLFRGSKGLNSRGICDGSKGCTFICRHFPAHVVSSVLSQGWISQVFRDILMNSHGRATLPSKWIRHVSTDRREFKTGELILYFPERGQNVGIAFRPSALCEYPIHLTRQWLYFHRFSVEECLFRTIFSTRPHSTKSSWALDLNRGGCRWKSRGGLANQSAPGVSPRGNANSNSSLEAEFSGKFWRQINPRIYFINKNKLHQLWISYNKSTLMLIAIYSELVSLCGKGFKNSLKNTFTVLSQRLCECKQMHVCGHVLTNHSVVYVVYNLFRGARSLNVSAQIHTCLQCTSWVIGGLTDS